METTMTNRNISRSKDFESFMRNANIGNESRDYLVMVGKLENWCTEYAGLIKRDFVNETADELISEFDGKVVELESQLMRLFSRKVLDNAMSYETNDL